jgi:hypothetical protein
MYRHYSVFLLVIMLCAGCQKQQLKQSYARNAKKTNAQVAYNEQEATQRKLYGTSQAAQYPKEIDVESADINTINVDYVWSIDMPIPLQAVEKKNNYYQALPNVYFTGYTVALERDDLVDFYKKQMELFGWHCWWHIDGLEALMLFEKPHKHCAISIRPSSSRKKQDIIILQKTV